MSSNSAKRARLAAAAAGGKSDGSPRRDGKAVDPGSPEARLAAAKAAAAAQAAVAAAAALRAELKEAGGLVDTHPARSAVVTCRHPQSAVADAVGAPRWCRSTATTAAHGHSSPAPTTTSGAC
jgi:hypothetical protein